MKGEHKGDFSRDTFDPSKHFLRVLMQQGRVSLDADWNEQVDILLHYMQTLAKDIIGPFAGPEGYVGFEIKGISNAEYDFKIGTGRYYVDGILCENEKAGKSCNSVVEDQGYYGSKKNGQPNYPITQTEFSLQNADLPLLVYLDIWERHISYVEDDDIREKALGWPDTASRSKVIWQVKVLEDSVQEPGQRKWTEVVNLETASTLRESMRKAWPEIEEEILQPHNRGCLKAQAIKAVNDTDPCITSPEARYRGDENQLYRVEIHRRGNALKNDRSNKDKAATFKWSRDNGSVIFPILNIIGNDTVMLEHLGRDDRLSLKVGEWVEVIDDTYTLLIQSRPTPLPGPRPLAQVDEVDLAEMKVTLKLKENKVLPTYESVKDKHPFLRRWDCREPDPTRQDEPEFADNGFSALFVEEGLAKVDGTIVDTWLTLEDGVQICFQNLTQGKPENGYQTGDYWLIPARTATGDVEWPYEIIKVDQKEVKKPLALPPHGINHHYAPLAVLADWSSIPQSCLCSITEPTTCYISSSSASVKKGRNVKGGDR
jgi:hypothetical protein